MSPSLHSSLLVFALEEEAGDHFQDHRLLFCGVGKINATFHLTQAIVRWEAQHKARPSHIINLGSAGSTQFSAGTLINCTRFIQRDMDATSLGCTAFATPFDETPHILKNGLRLDAFPEGVCGTGDSFATDGQTAPWNVVDMEAYALAKVCLFLNIPFLCLKYITDGADDNAVDSWQDKLKHAATSLKEATNRLSL